MVGGDAPRPVQTSATSTRTSGWGRVSVDSDQLAPPPLYRQATTLQARQSVDYVATIQLPAFQLSG